MILGLNKYLDIPMPLVFLDTETTGLPSSGQYTDLSAYESARMWELAFTLVDDLHSVDPPRSYSLLVNDFGAFPEAHPFPVPDHSTFTDDGKPAEQVLRFFCSVLGPTTVLVGHNLAFDLGIIKSELHRLGLPTAPVDQCPLLCTMNLATDQLRLPGKYGYKWPKLDELHYHFFGRNPSTSHRAGPDVMTTILCWNAMLYKGWLPVTPPTTWLPCGLA